MMQVLIVKVEAATMDVTELQEAINNGYQIIAVVIAWERTLIYTLIKKRDTPKNAN
jgi:hypothetical protein